jgi:hypothetical protein
VNGQTDKLSAAELAGLVDEYGDLSRFADEAKPKLDRREIVGKALQAHFAAAAADESHTAEGKRYDVIASAKATSRKITDIKFLFSLLKKEKFLELATIPLTLIDQHVRKDLHPRFLLEERAGRRTLKALPKVVPIFAERKKAA